MRALVYYFLSESASDKTEKADFKKHSDEDWETFLTKGGSGVQDPSVLPSRIATVSHGLPILPANSMNPVMLGEITTGTYHSPDKQWKIKLPDLWGNGEIWYERSSRGHQLLRIYDDGGQSYSLFLLTVEENNLPLDEWLLEQAVQGNIVLQELSFETDLGQANGYVYRDAKQEANCAVAFIPPAYHSDSRLLLLI